MNHPFNLCVFSFFVCIYVWYVARCEWRHASPTSPLHYRRRHPHQPPQLPCLCQTQLSVSVCLCLSVCIASFPSLAFFSLFVYCLFFSLCVCLSGSLSEHLSDPLSLYSVCFSINLSDCLNFLLPLCLSPIGFLSAFLFLHIIISSVFLHFWWQTLDYFSVEFLTCVCFVVPAFVFVFARCLLPHFIFLSIAPGPLWSRSGWRSDSDNEVLDHNIPRVTGFSRSG